MTDPTPLPSAGNPLHVLIPEDITAHNHGEAAILYGIRAALEEEGPVRISLCTGDAEQDARAYGSEIELIPDNVVSGSSPMRRWLREATLFCRHVLFASVCFLFGRRASRWFRAPLWKAYFRADLIVFGHDNVLVGRTRLSHLLVPVLARRLGIPCVVYAGTVGPFRGPLSRRLIGWLLRRTDLVTLREPRSLENARRLVGSERPPVRLAIDPAFLMPPASEPRVLEILRENGIPADARLVAMTTSAEMARRHAAAQGRDLRDGEDLYIRERAELADRLVEKGFWVVLLPHCVEGTGRRNDYLTNRKLAGFARHPERICLLPNRYAAQELKGLIGRCRMLVAERTHSMIAAASMAVPLVGISSAPTGTKTRGILGESMGLQDWLLDVESLTRQGLEQTVDRCLDQADAIRAGLQARLPEARRLARLPCRLALELVAARRPTARRAEPG